MQIANPCSTSLKCPTCRIQFTQDQVHRQHYKSDFHRYNLKRSMVSLLPATFEQFSTKRTQIRNQRQSSFQCGECRKTFSSQQTLSQHGESKKHNISMVQQQKSKIMTENKSVKYTRNEKRCLFCCKQFESMQHSIRHMARQHSFFIAEQSYCIDKSKLVVYLQQKIEVGMMCIFCDNKGAKDFTTGEAVRKHMLSKNHTFMNTSNGFQEYEDFYDFSQLFKEKLEEQKTYVAPVGINFQKVKVIIDDQKETSNINIIEIKRNKAKNQRVKVQGQKAQDQGEEYQSYEDQQQGEQQWQDYSDSQKNQNQIIEEQNENQQQLKQKKRRKVKAYQIMVPTLTATDQLLLPNGKTLGHRKYRNYYKQAVKMNYWFQDNKLRMIETGQHQTALILRNNLLDLIRRQQIMKSHLRREDKKYVKSGIQNSNLFRFFRSSNPK